MRKGWRKVVSSLLPLIAVSGCAGWFGSEEERLPSVLLFSVDSMRPDHLGCYGYDRATTPNIDAFAREGVRFNEAISASAWTTPSMISILTGMSPAGHRVEARGQSLNPALPALPRLLAQLGYEVPNLFYPNRIPNYENLGYGAPDPSIESMDKREALLAWLRAHQHERYFLWFHDAKLHLPYNPSDEYWSRFVPMSREEAANFSPGVHAVMNNVIIPEGTVPWRPRDREQVINLYDAELAETDAFFGEVIDVLREGESLDDTIVILTSDHGEELLDHGHVGHASTSKSATLYEEIVRVPLIFRYPAMAKQRRVEYAQVRSIDIAPTIFSLLGKRAPKEMQGFPLKAALEGKTFSSRPAYSETILAGYQSDAAAARVRLRSIRSDDWKLICRVEQHTSCRLYNLKADPEERRNMANIARARAQLLFEDLQYWAGGTDAMSSEGSPEVH
ncbi:MAG: sulfatase [Myxococcales bacterium]|nr:sulfatase [Myxococcales bacterium]